VSPRNNGKLAADLAKLARRPERHRYAFFMSPLFPGNERRPQFERDRIEVCVDLHLKRFFLNFRNREMG
jgi:hypothetical protein